MPFASGTFSLYSPGNPVVTGTTIASTWANNTLNDIATGLSTCLLKDGSQTVTANIPMSTFVLTGLGSGIASRTRSASIADIQDGQTIWCGNAGGTANAITLTATPAIPAYVAGQTFVFKATANNSGATTIQVSGVASPPAAQNNGSALVGSEIISGRWYRFTLTAASTGEIEEIAPVNGELRSVQVFTTTGANTYTTPSGLKRAVVLVTAGGGGGAGCNNAANSSAGAGGAGATAISLLTAAQIGTTQTATVGAGGAATSAGLNNGNDGNTSSFGSLISCSGGAKGIAANGNTAASGLGGAPSSGTIQMAGGDGITGNPTSPCGGTGGASYWGGGGAGGLGNASGTNARAKGSGGGGGGCTGGGAPSGGAGADGIIIVWEYF